MSGNYDSLIPLSFNINCLCNVESKMILQIYFLLMIIQLFLKITKYLQSQDHSKNNKLIGN